MLPACQKPELDRHICTVAEITHNRMRPHRSTIPIVSVYYKSCTTNPEGGHQDVSAVYHRPKTNNLNSRGQPTSNRLVATTETKDKVKKIGRAHV